MIDNLADIKDALIERLFFDVLPEFSQKLLEGEARDGQEPTVEFLRQQAREADARAKPEKPRALTTHDRKAIDKEFWDSM